MAYHMTHTTVCPDQKARLALLALQYMEHTQSASLSPREYALKYEAIYNEMCEIILPQPKG